MAGKMVPGDGHSSHQPAKQCHQVEYSLQDGKITVQHRMTFTPKHYRCDKTGVSAPGGLTSI